MAKMSTKALLKRDAKRNIGDELLQAAGKMKAGNAGNVHRAAMSAVTTACTTSGLHDAVAAPTRWSIGALGSDQNAPAPEDTPTSLPDHGQSLSQEDVVFEAGVPVFDWVSNSWFEEFELPQKSRIVSELCEKPK